MTHTALHTLTYEHFRRWILSYSHASEQNDPQASCELFAPDARYYESPFDAPMIGRDALFEYWKKGAQTLKDKISCHEILAVHNHLGIARWRSRCTAVKSGKHLALDCLFVVEFNDEGLCQTFREWWHMREHSARESNHENF